MNLQELRQQIYDRHDIYCNQKYADNLPYSFHIKCVESQGEKFIHLIDIGVVENKENAYSKSVVVYDIIRLALSAHDLIEDARMTYNDIKDLASELGNSIAGEVVADIVYTVTDEKGKTRKERKSDKYYKELSQNKFAVFVKLADISANTLFSKLTGSSMYSKYKAEFANFKEKCYIEEYSEFFNYLEKL